MDTESQEGLETFMLSLSVTSAQPVILQDTLTVNIEDTTREFAAHTNHFVITDFLSSYCDAKQCM